MAFGVTHDDEFIAIQAICEALESSTKAMTEAAKYLSEEELIKTQIPKVMLKAKEAMDLKNQVWG